MKISTCIGLMSGSSMDGVDLVLVRFKDDEEKYDFEILDAETIQYSKEWKYKLSNAFSSDPEQIAKLDLEYGKYLGTLIQKFSEKHHGAIDFVASHGHTVFHKPEIGYTLQIGNGETMAKTCKLKIINDFRTEDVSIGGQGAPLVPIGDELLFHDYGICLNIGGIANLSFNSQGKRIAYDICIANQSLNYMASKIGFSFDKDGEISRSGKTIIEDLMRLNQHDYYKITGPKSLGREFFEQVQKPLIEASQNKIEDLLCTFTEHIAQQIANTTENIEQTKMLITGGGAYNQYLLERIKHHTKHNVVVPQKNIIDYKEALIFAFLGLLKLENRTNVLASVTGAPRDSSSGKIWMP
jgi:Predicted molecular chaperone distantly related to HSP70-fold metalloproteases